MTRWQRSRTLLLALVLGAISAGGCGSGTGSTPTRRAPGAGFMAELNAACRADRAATLRAAKTGSAQAAAQRTFIRTLLTLTPPHALRPVFSRYISALQQNLATFEHNNVAASKRLVHEIVSLTARLRKAGATSC